MTAVQAASPWYEEERIGDEEAEDGERAGLTGREPDGEGPSWVRDRGVGRIGCRGLTLPCRLESPEVENDDASVGIVLVLAGTTWSRVAFERQFQARPLVVFPYRSVLLFFALPDLLDDKRRKHRHPSTCGDVLSLLSEERGIGESTPLLKANLAM
ncbi:hypothetical protein [Chondromyces apiculatus]|uniref:hypothetical protein n=1 Tax=Chondromyces apiculatus TaxID=51 RepID=UPI0012DEBC13|nr:hypothetical protein [Chondromyces apiculatus]